MSAKSTVRRLGRRLAAKTPPRLKSALPAPLARTARQFLGRGKEPILSVIIPVYNVEEYLPEALDSVLAQTLTRLEILVVDDGSTDNCPAIIADYARRHPTKIRTFKQANAGQGPARNLAVREARGEFITFMDSDDIIPPDAYRYMVKSLRKSGSDFSVGAARRIQNGRLSNPVWNGPVHGRDRMGITLDDYPTALLDVIACNRMFRREFWVDQVGDYRGGIAYEDHVPMVKAYVLAKSFDLLAKTTYHWRIRENLTSTGQQKKSLQNLLDRIEVKAEAWEFLTEKASDSVRAAWIGRVLDTDFPPYIEHAHQAGAEYQAALSRAFQTYQPLADAEAMDMIRVQQKMRGHLAARGAWEKMEGVQRPFREHAMPPTRVVDGRVCVRPDFFGSAAADIPQEMLELSAAETDLRASFDRAAWLDAHRLELHGWAFVKNVDYGEETPHTELWLEDGRTGSRIPLEIEAEDNPRATVWSSQRHMNCSRSGFRTVIDVRPLLEARAAAPGDRREHVGQLRVRTTVQGITREGTFHRAPRGTSAANLRATQQADGLRVVPRDDAELGYVVALQHPKVAIASLRTTEDEVRGELTVARSGHCTPHKVLFRRLGTTSVITAEARHESDTTSSFAVPLSAFDDPESDGPAPSEWEVRISDTSGVKHFVEWPAGADDARTLLAGPVPAALARSPRGYVRLHLHEATALVTDVVARDDHLHVSLTGSPTTLAALDSARLQGFRAVLPARTVRRDGDVAELSFRLTHDAFGHTDIAAPTGEYRILVTDQHGNDVPAQTSEEFCDRVTLTLDARFHQVQVLSVPQRIAVFRVQPPLGEDETGNWAQAQLKLAYQDAESEPEDAVLFQCYRGETATDSQLALHRFLHTQRPELTLYWGVADHATTLPAGAVPLVIGSSRWYEKLGRVTHLCNNVDFDSFFRKKPHQRYLQTFHGYPFKSMGKTFWRGKSVPEDRVEHECRRRNRDWDTILVPAEFCAEFYRTEYDYTGQILTLGYPRCDALVGPDHVADRARTRAVLGIEDDKTVVLYAPTYRDSLTTRTFAARRFDELDLTQLSEALGDSFVVLVRGHNNNQRDPGRVRDVARVIDVTDYPEINDLTLAADVAILDYSSLRFDWAITRKPVLFFVPDVDEYFDQRPPLFDYAKTTPGPLLATTEAVVAALRDLDRVADESETALATFNHTYNQMHDGRATERVAREFFDLPDQPRT